MVARSEDAIQRQRDRALDWWRQNPEKRAVNKRRYQSKPEVKSRRAENQRRRYDLRGRGSSKLLRVELFIRQLGRCGICSGQLDPNEIEVDHIVPLARDGSDDRSNKQAAHPRCNRRKGAR